MNQLVECTMCKKLISPNAKVCPNCGETNTEKKSNDNVYRVKRIIHK